MKRPYQDDQVPFFTTEDVEAELISAGYQFEPPNHFATVRVSEVLAGLTDVELVNWPSELSKAENQHLRNMVNTTRVIAPAR